ncbi:hypothetical protein NQ314_011817 [Rhamnusium bicolor]|uniref:Uncharacterized protein n=1 Tax=Rhamnusium bicolor TaxID=1586634 RepID=A0AAV8XEV1_9CUCU|nr:hypothetical protein NQ314_011817 [Rhamnusium bicolor]
MEVLAHLESWKETVEVITDDHSTTETSKHSSEREIIPKIKPVIFTQVRHSERKFSIIVTDFFVLLEK